MGTHEAEEFDMNLEDVPNVYPHALRILSKRLDALVNAAFISIKWRLATDYVGDDGEDTELSEWEEADISTTRASILEELTSESCDYINVTTKSIMLWYLTQLDELTEADWLKASDHLNFIMQRYQEVGRERGTNTQFALTMVFLPLRARFDEGERTHVLYEDMLGAE